MTVTAIDIEVLREEINRSLDMFIAKGVTQVELQSDHYWDFGWDERHLQPGATSADQPEAAVGSLVDDLSFVLSGHEGERVALTLCHIAPLINYLGIKAGDHGVFVEEQ